MVVSAEASGDVNNRPLTFHWVVLRGDPAKVHIKPLNEAKSVAEIRVEYPTRRPVAEGSAIESPRVDVGVFAHNGAYYSAPAFVTFFPLEDEGRTYDQNGRLLEIGYGMGESTLTVSNWPALFDALKAGADANRPGVKLLTGRFTEAELAAVRKAGEDYAAASAAVATAGEARQSAQTALDAANANAQTPAEEKTRLEEALRAADATLQAAQQSAEQILSQPREGLAKPVRPLVEGALNDLAADVNFLTANAEALRSLFEAADDGRKSAIAGARTRLARLGVAKEGPAAGVDVELTPIRPGDAPAAERLTDYEKSQLRRYHAEALAALAFPGEVTAAYTENLVDFRLTAPKTWRDVYRYDEQGNPLGWTRHDPDSTTGPADFDAEGRLVLERNAQGRRVRTRNVRYDRNRDAGFPFPLKAVPGSQVFHYEYEGDADREGRVTKTETVAEGT